MVKPFENFSTYTGAIVKQSGNLFVHVYLMSGT